MICLIQYLCSVLICSYVPSVISKQNCGKIVRCYVINVIRYTCFLATKDHFAQTFGIISPVRAITGERTGCFCRHWMGFSVVYQGYLKSLEQWVSLMTQTGDDLICDKWIIQSISAVFPHSPINKDQVILHQHQTRNVFILIHGVLDIILHCH